MAIILRNDFHHFSASVSAASSSERLKTMVPRMFQIPSPGFQAGLMTTVLNIHVFVGLAICVIDL
jgi:hypothetical protein